MSFEELLHRNSEAEEIGAATFLPHAFAVNKTSPLYVKLFNHFKEREDDDTTSFEAAQYVWRCLGGSVVIAPCARLGSPNIYTQLSFDPRLSTKDDAVKKRIADTWFEDYRPLALRLIGNGNVAEEGRRISGVIEETPPEGCK